MCPPLPSVPVLATTVTAATQFHLSLTALIVGILSFTRLPEVSRFLFCRWQACRVIDSALDWVIDVDENYIPCLQRLLQTVDNPDIQKTLIRLDIATKEYVLLFLRGYWALTHRSCMILLWIIKIRDRYNRTFLPGNIWQEGRRELIQEAEVEITKVRHAFSVSTDPPA